MTSTTTVLQPKPPLTGIRGWLALLGLGMIVAPIRAIYTLFKYYAGEVELTTFQHYPVMMIGELVLNLLWFAFILYVSAVFFKEKSIFKKVFTIEVLMAPVFVFVDYLWVCAVTGTPFATLINEQSAAEQIGTSVGYLIAGLPWVAYVWRSRRVTNTFVN